MTLKEYEAKYGKQVIEDLIAKTKSSPMYFYRLVNGVKGQDGVHRAKVPGRFTALHIEHLTLAEVGFHDLMQRPTDEEFSRYLAGLEKTNNKEETS